jgi:hypothetical protein
MKYVLLIVFARFIVSQNIGNCLIKLTTQLTVVDLVSIAPIGCS